MTIIKFELLLSQKILKNFFMKKLLTIFIFLILANLISAQVYKTVNLQTAGTLTTLLTATEKTTVTNLTITGKIDARDFKFLLFEVPLLTALDLSGTVIQAYNGTEGSSVDGLSINSINTMPPFSFYDGGITATRNMKSIIFPNSLVSIGDCAFYWSGLINVTIPNSVTTIGEMAFNACFSLSTFTIGSSVTSIGGGAFHMCNNLKTIKSLNSIPPVLGNNCFDGVSPTVIYVPVGAIGAYKAAAGWSAFTNILEYMLAATTKPVTSITLSSATLNASIDLITNTPVTAHGFCWNTSGSPTLSDNKVDNGSKTTEGEFSNTITNLVAATRYYVRAYATDGERTVYGNELTFTTATIPSAAGSISGLQTVCQGQNPVTYTVPVINNATSYIWTLPAGIVGTSTTNTIAVKYERYFTTGGIAVKGHNEWGDGTSSTLEITANLLPLIAGAISGNKTVCQGENSVNYTVPAVDNATSYKWVLPSGATGSSTTNSITVDYSKSAISGNITVKGHNDCGDGIVSYSMITVNQLPIIELRDTALMSEGSVILYPTISYTGSGKLKYKWTPSTGLDNDTIAHPLATVTSKITYTLVVTTASGCSTSADVKVDLLSMAQPEIGIVGVTSSNKNMVVWNKPVTTGIASYYIYKETNTSNVFEKIGTVPYDSLSVFVDNQSFPEVKSNKYKLSIFDNNGMESPLSNAHKTMHLSINKGQNTTWNLIWEAYEGFNVSTYNIYRGTNANNLNFIDATSGSSNQYSDLTAPAGDVYYQLEVISPNLINPTKIQSSQKAKAEENDLTNSLLLYSSSRSNIVTNVVNWINETEENNKINIYPNPVKNELRIDFKSASIFEILNLMGQVVYNGDLNKNTIVQTSNLSSGVYLIKFKTGKSFEYKKIIKE